MPLTDEEVLEKYKETRDNLVEQRLQISLNPKPSYNIDGQEVKWNEYLSMLDKRIDAMNLQVAKLEPFEIVENWYPAE